MESTIPRWLGFSNDGRTNRWSVTCPKCGNSFEPRTTMFRKIELDCQKPKCRAELIADFGAPKITIATHPKD